MVVLAIASILLSLVQPLYSAAVPGARFRAEVHDLAAAIRAARNEAILSAEIVEISIDEEALTYAVDAKPPLTLSAATNLKLGSTLLASATVAGKGKSVPGQTTKSLTFFSDGSSSGGSIFLQGNSSAYVISVDWLTGRVRIQATDHELT
jgi:general secretion pathway protein H